MTGGQGETEENGRRRGGERESKCVRERGEMSVCKRGRDVLKRGERERTRDEIDGNSVEGIPPREWGGGKGYHHKSISVKKLEV